MTRILWVHNFSADVVASGVFMHLLFRQMAAAGEHVTLFAAGNLRRPVQLLRSGQRLRALSAQYDLVHAQFGSACGFVAGWSRVPCLMTLRGTDLLGCDTGRWQDRAHGLACRWLTRLGLCRARRVIVMSQRMRRELAQFHGYPWDHIDVLPDGIDLQQFRPLDRDEARRRLGLGDDRSPWILFSSVGGEANPIKRAPLAMAAVESLRRRRPDVQLKFLTGQPHERVPLWVNACDAVLLTSTREGWPNIVKEALACNVPFVSTDVSDLAAIAAVEPSCSVTEPRPETLADGLAKAIQHGRPTSLRRHVEWMELGAVAQSLGDIYRRLCPSRAAAGRAA